MNKNSRFLETSKQQVVSITYEEIGLFPRSFNRVFDRFFKQLFFDVENLVIQEYRFYRYLFLTTVKCLFILFFVPLSINFLSKNYLIRPITEYYWNTHNHEIFLNSYQQKRAFTEFKNFEEKIYFESLLLPENQIFRGNSEMSLANDFNQQFYTQFPQIIEYSHSNFLKNLTQQKYSFIHAKGLLGPFFIQHKNSHGIPVHEKRVQEERFQTKFTFFSKNLGNIPNNFVLNKENQKNLHGKDLIYNLRTSPILIKRKKLNSSDFVMTSSSSFQNSMLPLVTNLSSQKAELNLDFSTVFKTSFQKRLQVKIFELANHYNEESIEAITNFFADVLSFSSLCFLLVRLEIQINITKSFLLEVFFGLDDSKKSLLILFTTDLLVGYHSPNIWELFFQTLFDHYGLPESQTTIFLLVATLPVLLDVLFKYLIFRHLNRASPATVATYHAMIE